jgi:hypothetical protein
MGMQGRLLRIVLAAAATLWLGAAVPAEPAGSATALHAQYAALESQLDHNAFGRPLHLDSREANDRLEGDVHAVLDHPFAQVERALAGGTRWCDILLLHLNVKACRAAGGESTLRVYIGRKFDQPPSAAHRIDFTYRVLAEAPGYFQVSLGADRGPFGTHDYRIVAEAIPLGERTFLHLSYAYAYGVRAKVAMQAYLATVGARKVGFTREREADGAPVLVGGLRGALERNVMRYYLAIEAYLDAQSSPPGERLEDRLRDWFQSTERYALQLHELDEDAYLEMKRRECATPSSRS